MWLVYVGIAGYGCSQVVEGLIPKNLVPEDTYVYEYFLHLNPFWHIGPQLHVLCERPPNLTQYEGRQKILQLVNDFENMPEYGYGRNGTTFWFLAYYNYLDSINAKHENTTELWSDIYIYIKLILSISYFQFSGTANCDIS
jgi:hypothetical protein